MKSNIKKFLQSQQWIKALSRDIPFIRLVMIYESFYKRSRKDIGWSYPAGVSISHQGIFDIYRSKEGMADFINNFLKLRNKKQYLKNLLRKTKLVKKQTEKDIKFCEKKLKVNSKITHKELLKLFKILYQSFKNFWNLQYFPLALEAALSNSSNDDVVSKYKKCLVAIRQQSQYVTAKLEDLIDSTLKRIAKNKNLPQSLVFYATPLELINNRLIKKTLVERKKISILISKNNELVIYQGKRAKDLAKYFKRSEKELPTKEIKGHPAYQGKVRGVVKVILYRKDLKNLKKNQILVASMTEAYYTPYLKEVKAIITDEGGITCHAAIVSRELKTPCIIGTKIATKALKDGDLVKVDAEKGIVEIIEKR